MNMPAGLHIVKKLRRGKPVLWYVYAWRGGPQIMRKEGGPAPAVTAALTDAAAVARRARPEEPTGTLKSLIDCYTASAEYRKLAASTRYDYEAWHQRILAEFADTPLSVFSDRRLRADILEWRDLNWAAKPRTADMAITAFSAFLSWAVDRGYLPVNILLGATRLYDVDRSDIIWEPQHFAAFRAVAAIEVLEGVELAAATGLRRGDLVKLPWSAIGEHAIVWRTSKSRGRNLVTIPLLPETRDLLKRIKARQEAAMLRRRVDKRRPLPETVLASSYLRPWTAAGFGSRFNDYKTEAGIDVHLHDLRGTFATRCMLSGLTDQEIADILGWSTKDVAAIRAKYVSSARVVIAIGERLARASS